MVEVVYVAVTMMMTAFADRVVDDDEIFRLLMKKWSRLDMRKVRIVAFEMNDPPIGTESTIMRCDH